MNKPLLEVRNLSHSYGKTRALTDVSFNVATGEMFGLLGPNGAGKTTLLSIVSGLLNATSGEVLIDGKAFTDQHEVRRQIGIVPQEIAIYGELTARENLHFFGELYGVQDAERVDSILRAIGLMERANDRASTFSGGMKRRLNLGCALVHQPRLLLLDEPTVGVDPQSRNHIFEEVRRLNREGVTIVYTSHYMEEVQSLCTRVGIIDWGKLIACDSVSSLLSKLDGEIVLRAADFPESVLSRLNAIAEVHQSEDGVVRLICRDVKSVLLEVATIFKEQRVELTNLELHEPDLERVFLHLTGSALRD